MEGSMYFSVNSKLIERVNQQFWLMVFILLLPLTSYCAVSVNFNTMLNALRNNAGPIIIFTVATAYVIGTWFIISAIMGLKKIGESTSAASQTHSSISGPLVKLLVGVLLVYLPTAIDVSVATLWGHGVLNAGSDSPMSYSSSGSGGPFGPAKEGAIAIVRVVGYVSFVRGLIILSRSADQGAQQGTFGKGFMHIIGGVLAINIVETIRIIGNTLGFTII
jgi:intracellular multiplication protein IcmC